MTNNNNNNVIYIINESFEDEQYDEFSQRFAGMYSGLALSMDDAVAFVEKRKQEQLELWNLTPERDEICFFKNKFGYYKLIIPDLKFEYTWVIKAELPFVPEV